MLYMYSSSSVNWLTQPVSILKKGAGCTGRPVTAHKPESRPRPSCRLRPTPDHGIEAEVPQTSRTLARGRRRGAMYKTAGTPNHRVTASFGSRNSSNVYT